MHSYNHLVSIIINLTKLAKTLGPIRNKTKNLIYPSQVLANLFKGGKTRSMTSHPRSQRSLKTDLIDPSNSFKTTYNIVAIFK
jgi:hypothetical protein